MPALVCNVDSLACLNFELNVKRDLLGVIAPSNLRPLLPALRAGRPTELDCVQREHAAKHLFYHS